MRSRKSRVFGCLKGRGVSVQMLAKKLEMPYSTLSAYLNEYIPVPDHAKMKIAAALDVDFNFLWNEEIPIIPRFSS